MAAATQRLKENFSTIRRRINDAAQRVGRRGEEITLVAVTKYIDEHQTVELWQAGCRDLGESRPQELWRKAEIIQSPDVRWHLVGHLQRNKVRRTLPLVSLIHSADSLRILEEIDRQASSLGIHIPLLLEVNISGDKAKHGFQPAEMQEALRAATQLMNVQVRGLMGMARGEGDLMSARHDFQQLRELRDVLRAEEPNGSCLAELSMGMSGDFEVAVEEGATMVRIGSALFEGIET